MAIGNPAAPKILPEHASLSMPFTDWAFVRLDENGQPHPKLALAWQTTDRRTWTLTLPPNIHTHDGQLLTTERLRASLLEHARRNTQFQIWRELQSIQAPTPTTLVLQFAQPSSVVLEALSRVPQQMEAPALSAGPFRLVNETATRLDLAAFRDFWKGPPRLAGIRYDLYPSARAAWAAFLRHDADYLVDPPPDVLTSLAQDPGIHVHHFNPWQFYLLNFQVAHPALADVRVRQALNLAIDREALVQRLFADYAQQPEYTRLTTAPFAPGYWAAQDAAPAWPYDPAAARALLATARKGHHEPLELHCIVVGQVQVLSDIGAALEAQLERVHVRLRLEALPVAEYMQRVFSGDFELALSPMTMGYGGALWPYAVWRSRDDHPLLGSGYTATDAALDALYYATTPEAERQAAQEVVKTMRRNPPAAFLMPKPMVTASHAEWLIETSPVSTHDFADQWALKGFTPCAAP